MGLRLRTRSCLQIRIRFPYQVPPQTWSFANFLSHAFTHLRNPFITILLRYRHMFKKKKNNPSSITPHLQLRYCILLISILPLLKFLEVPLLYHLTLDCVYHSAYSDPISNSCYTSFIIFILHYGIMIVGPDSWSALPLSDPLLGLSSPSALPPPLAMLHPSALSITPATLPTWFPTRSTWSAS
jgi:hypothetical protein